MEKKSKYIRVAPTILDKIEQLAEIHGTESEAIAVAVENLWHEEIAAQGGYAGWIQSVREFLEREMGILEKQVAFMHDPTQTMAEPPAWICLEIEDQQRGAVVETLRDLGAPPHPASASFTLLVVRAKDLNAAMEREQ